MIYACYDILYPDIPLVLRFRMSSQVLLYFKYFLSFSSVKSKLEQKQALRKYPACFSWTKPSLRILLSIGNKKWLYMNFIIESMNSLIVFFCWYFEAYFWYLVEWILCFKDCMIFTGGKCFVLCELCHFYTGTFMCLRAIRYKVMQAQRISRQA